MMTLAEPPYRWDAETTTPPVLETLAAAVDPITGSMVKADVRRLEPWYGFKNGCVVSPRQVGSCAERVRSLMESGMQWLRLYHDTPNNPKLRFVSVDSKQPMSAVLSVWMWMLVNASESSQRGTLEKWRDDLYAAALDLEEEAVTAIRQSMQSVMLDGDRLIEWDKRQVSSDSQRLPWQEWAAIREAIFKRDNFTCGYCGQQGGHLECDHVVPLSRGGTNDRANLITACYDCNRSKGSFLLHEWRVTGTKQ